MALILKWLGTYFKWKSCIRIKIHYYNPLKHHLTPERVKIFPDHLCAFVFFLLPTGGKKLNRFLRMIFNNHSDLAIVDFFLPIIRLPKSLLHFNHMLSHTRVYLQWLHLLLISTVSDLVPTAGQFWVSSSIRQLPPVPFFMINTQL